MLVRVEEEGALVIGQLSHSWLSGQLARVWGNEAFPAPEPREEIALGAEQHDIGWSGADLAPRLDPETGLPRGFLETSPEQHLDIWRDAPDMLATQSLHAALVVSLHGRSLSELRAQGAPGHPGLQEHIAAERERQTRLCAVLAISPDAMERTRRQMWTWDALSLALCNAWDPFTVKDVPGRDGLVDIELRGHGDAAVALDPWPFAPERVAVRCEARRLTRRYEDEDALREALAASPPVTLEFVLEAG